MTIVNIVGLILIIASIVAYFQVNIEQRKKLKKLERIINELDKIRAIK